MTPSLPSLNPIPADIDDVLRGLLHAPPDPAIGDWLQELIQYSGHLSAADDMRWRLLGMVWLATVYDIEAGWPYLRWLNMSEETISGHLSEMLIEAVDNLGAHVPVANWLAAVSDDRLRLFFRDFYLIPAQRHMAPLLSRLLAQPDRPETGVWLVNYCQGTAHNDGKFMRPWRLLTAAWLAAKFDHAAGLASLKKLTNGAASLPAEDNALLMNAAEQTNGMAALIQMIADCPDKSVQTMLRDFGHPNLPALARDILEAQPDYAHLADAAELVAFDAAIFRRVQANLQAANLLPGAAKILNLACGPLAEQALLLSSAGYKVIGVDLDLPPKFLPAGGLKLWFKRRQHHRAWQQATAAYFEALAQQVGTKLKWNNAAIKLADLTRLAEAEASFEAVICLNHLQHAPNVNGLLAEAARVLKPGGLFIANIRPFVSLTGALQVDLNTPWGHLRDSAWAETAPQLPLNRWREAQFKAALEQHFATVDWEPENEPQTLRLLTPDIRAELAAYSEDELTRKQIWVVAHKG
ncbi:MAG: hypothetical protein FOGNACKC_04449 [Anaerolineae bacterium]|nr:hypothetical protein [Anaerolineae bacterium]